LLVHGCRSLLGVSGITELASGIIIATPVYIGIRTIVVTIIRTTIVRNNNIISHIMIFWAIVIVVAIRCAWVAWIRLPAGVILVGSLGCAAERSLQ
jgi:hypothetical protein